MLEVKPGDLLLSKYNNFDKKYLVKYYGPFNVLNIGHEASGWICTDIDSKETVGIIMPTSDFYDIDRGYANKQKALKLLCLR